MLFQLQKKTAHMDIIYLYAHMELIYEMPVSSQTMLSSPTLIAVLSEQSAGQERPVVSKLLQQ